MLSAFNQVHQFRQFTEWSIPNFCASIFDDLDRNPYLKADVTEIYHYKENQYVEHEFLLAMITHSQKQYMMRLERSALQSRRRLSSSASPALDTVRISTSLTELTSKMERGPSYPVAKLVFSSQQPFALRELCLILSLFPAFSPNYRPRTEQCYWFCYVVLLLATTCDGVSKVDMEGASYAGKFKGIYVPPSPQKSKLFLDAYSIVRTLGLSSQLVTLPSVTIGREGIDTLVSMLGVPSSEARTRTIIALASLASQSPEYRQIVAEANTVTKIINIIPDASLQLKVRIFTALDALIDKTVVHGLEAADVSTLVQFLSSYLPSNGEVDVQKVMSLMRMVDPEEANLAFGRLWSSLSLELAPHIQLFTLEATIACINQNPPLITDEILLQLFNMLPPAAPPQTRTKAIFALSHLVPQYLSRARLNFDGPEAGELSEEVQSKAVSLLIDNNVIVRSAALEGLTELANHIELHPAIKKGTPWLLQLLKDHDNDVRVASMKAITILVAHVELCAAIGDAIPQLLQLLQNNANEVKVASAIAITKLAEHTDFRATIRDAMPDLLRTLLMDYRSYAEIAGANAMAQLAEYAELRDVIGTAVPQLLNLLEKPDGDVRDAGAKTIVKLVEYPELRAAIRNAVPELLRLLKNGDKDVRAASSNAVVQLAGYAELRAAIGHAILQVFYLLNDGDEDIRVTSVNAIVELAGHTEFRSAIENVIPQVVQLLKDNVDDVQVASASAIAKLMEHTKFRTAIGNALPQLLMDCYAKISGPNAMAQLVEYTKLHAAIKNGISLLLPLLTNEDEDVRVASKNAIMKLVEHGEFRTVIEKEDPQLLERLELSP